MSTDPDKQQATEFESQSRAQQTGIIRDCIDLLKENRKWWLVPLVVVVLLVGGLILLGGTAAAPFIYTLF